MAGPTLRDVAALAGVSVTTASHAISGRRRVSSAAAEKVAAAMAQLNYVPDYSAQALAQGKTWVIALIVPDITNPFFAELTKGVADVVDQSGYSVVLGNSEFQKRREQHYLKKVAQRAVDGLIFAAGAASRTTLLREIAQRCPVVIADEPIGGSSVPAVVADHRHGGALVAAHLSALGHRSYLVIRGPKNLPSTRLRTVGFTRELARQTAGEVDGEEVQIRIADGDYREESGYDAVINLIKNDSSLPTAIFAENDLMAIGAIQALTENELEVPRHISVAGYDDSLRARYTSPSLTTIHQPAYEIGRQAAIRLLGGPESWRSSQKAERVPVSLVVRESTGPRREVCESI